MYVDAAGLRRDCGMAERWRLGCGQWRVHVHAASQPAWLRLAWVIASTSCLILPCAAPPPSPLLQVVLECDTERAELLAEEAQLMEQLGLVRDAQTRAAAGKQLLRAIQLLNIALCIAVHCKASYTSVVRPSRHAWQMLAADCVKFRVPWFAVCLPSHCFAAAPSCLAIAGQAQHGSWRSSRRCSST
jgi:hypothetical protein